MAPSTLFQLIRYIFYFVLYHRLQCCCAFCHCITSILFLLLPITFPLLSFNPSRRALLRAIRLCHQSLQGPFTFHLLPQSPKATAIFLEFCYSHTILPGIKTHSRCYGCNINYSKLGDWQQLFIMQMESVGQELCGSGLSLIYNICEMEDLKFGAWNHLKSCHSQIWRWI